AAWKHCAATPSDSATSPTTVGAHYYTAEHSTNLSMHSELRRAIKPIGYGAGRDGQRRRLYDEPMTPLDRLLAAGVLSPAQESELLAYRDTLNPAAIARQIADLQAALLRLAKNKTEHLYLAAIPTALPEVRSGIRIQNKTAS
ncbi:hypothetical protein QRB32_28085, partial [Mycobacterium intracellulare subsp. chimaera]|nr:hypothetical protein [Mycobacterium intracellulare subsp. chimaera]MDM3935995.1 hypothetical protein [Mycobacterium intracellulare subsp. chimaera]MDO2361313.1 hypothetical protein [Mycobacterium avium subsp. hominissuis]MDO2392050.1 hypothetical protein [Mycobacterium avium subsp. hominissuis]MDO2397714.1 hypothetical protein [Mycobacterium avium subsp. hominissuis]